MVKITQGERRSTREMGKSTWEKMVGIDYIEGGGLEYLEASSLFFGCLVFQPTQCIIRQ